MVKRGDKLRALNDGIYAGMQLVQGEIRNVSYTVIKSAQGRVGWIYTRDGLQIDLKDFSRYFEVVR